MTEMLAGWYPWLKWLHIVAVISWMAALLYLPRLFVYHVEASSAEVRAEYAMAEIKLLKRIMTPAMIVTWIAGITLMIATGAASEGWLLLKLVLVVVMTGFHGMCGKWQKQIAAGTCERTGRFFRMANEVPTILMIAIVGLVVIKPF